MTVGLIVAVAAITIGSRLVAMVVLPEPSGAFAEWVRRLPAPLFAALAALNLTGADDGFVDPRLLVATACALAVARWASLLVTLAAGVAGFAVSGLIWPG